MEDGKEPIEKFMAKLSKRLTIAEEEIVRLQSALSLIANHPVQESKEWEIGAKEMLNLANNTLKNGYRSEAIYSFDRNGA